jgi:anti-sigma regulatory factor (Ser/Thr protein kinase)
MSEPKADPPRCEFEVDKLIVKIDEVVACNARVIDDLVAKITGLIDRAGCREIVEKIYLALREALTNAIVGISRSDRSKVVRICVALEADCGLLIIVKDSGSRVNPSRLPNPVLGQNVFAGHGRGIFLINMITDHVRFGFENGTLIYMRRGQAGN